MHKSTSDASFEIIAWLQKYDGGWEWEREGEGEEEECKNIKS